MAVCEGDMVQKVLRLPAVLEASGKCKAAIYADIRAGTFPKPIRLDSRSSGWLESEIEAWQEARKAERDAASKEDA